MALSNRFNYNRCQASLSASEGVASPLPFSSIEHMKNFCYKLGICESIISKLISKSCSSNSRIINMLTLKIDFHPSWKKKKRVRKLSSKGDNLRWWNSPKYEGVSTCWHLRVNVAWFGWREWWSNLMKSRSYWRFLPSNDCADRVAKSK